MAAAAYEVSLTRRTNAVLQFQASESAIREMSLEEIKANKYQASLGLHSRQGRLVYSFAVTENLVNFQNTPDIGLSLMLGWMPRVVTVPPFRGPGRRESLQGRSNLLQGR